MQEEKAGPGSGAGMTGGGEPPPWMVEFLASLIFTGSVREALVEAGVDFETAWALRAENGDFAFYWDRALWVHREVAVPVLAACRAAEAGGGEVVH